MGSFKEGEVWFVGFPLEEDDTQIINRPVVVLDEDKLGVLSVKVTKHKVRSADPYDTPILYWQQANLRLASTASLIFLVGQCVQARMKKTHGFDSLTVPCAFTNASAGACYFDIKLFCRLR